ncbi:uncharacterized protein G2W53_020482 [Senna tora]|uniref:Uncharacterized protein n=1 Tax=Senna tora TaxID=362788 RepID=A0A834TVI7_9FABA|nr:uncharacterized protein G2W53_020482 [Senna tora]
MDGDGARLGYLLKYTSPMVDPSN